MKKTIQIILICIILVGTILIATIGFNVGIKYSEHKQININLGKEFNNEDIQKIVKETLGNKNVLVQKVELYNEMVQITVEDASEEEIQNLKNKIIEKYELNEQSDIFTVTNEPNVRLRNIIKPYILPVILVSILVTIYAIIMFRKMVNVKKIIYIMFFSIVGSQAILSSIYAITRLPINRLSPIIAIIVYILSMILPIVKLNKQKNLIKENNK